MQTGRVMNVMEQLYIDVSHNSIYTHQIGTAGSYKSDTSYAKTLYTLSRPLRLGTPCYFIPIYYRENNI